MLESPFHSWLTGLPVAQEKFFVVRQEARWKVRHEGQHWGPYYLQAEAVHAAVEKAQFLGRGATGGVQVFVQVKEDEFRLAWTYGLDPYPLPQEIRN